jgi:hypothetical protein
MAYHLAHGRCSRVRRRARSSDPGGRNRTGPCGLRRIARLLYPPTEAREVVWLLLAALKQLVASSLALGDTPKIIALGAFLASGARLAHRPNMPYPAFGATQSVGGGVLTPSELSARRAKTSALTHSDDLLERGGSRLALAASSHRRRPVPMAVMDPGLRPEDNKGRSGVSLLNESEH